MQDYLFIRKERKYTRLELQDLEYIQSQGNYLLLKLSDQEIRIKGNLCSLLDHLPHYFIQANRSYVVNFKKILSFDNKCLKLPHAEIAISGDYKEKFLQVLNQYVYRV